MNVDQIAKMRDYNLADDGTGNPIASVFSYLFNNELAFISSRDYIVCDDANELIHAVKVNNEDPINQARYPMKIMTGFYGNLQYTEALYTMSNFKKAVKEQFLDSGLIDQKKFDMIIKWADSIRNHAVVPKAPGPYFRDTTLVVPQSPVAEVRKNDGLYHASATNHITAINELDAVVEPLIDAIPDVRKKSKYWYEIKTNDVSTLPATFKSILDSVPNLWYGSLGDSYGTTRNAPESAIYNPRKPKTIETFIKNAKLIMPNSWRKIKNLTLNVEANGSIRSTYNFHICLGEYDHSEEEAKKFTKAVTDTMDEYFENVISDIGEFYPKDRSFSWNIDSETDENGIVDDMISTMMAIEGVNKITYTVGGSTLEYVVNMDDIQSDNNTTLNTFVERMVQTMPNENGQSKTGSVAAVSAAGASVVYTLKVKYWDETECSAVVDGVFYNTVNDAIAAAGTNPVVININRDSDETISIPAGANVTINLSGHTLSSATDHVINNSGTLTVDGTGTITVAVANKATILNNSGAVANILGGNFTRPEFDANGAKNGYYAFDNKGTMTIGAEGADNSLINVTYTGDAASLVENGYADTTGMSENDPVATMVINSGNFIGGLYTIKNDELANLTVNGGYFENYTKNAILNWDFCTVNNGTFVANEVATLNNGIYGLGHGSMKVFGGTFESGSAVGIKRNDAYGSDDIEVFGGTFSADPSEFVATGYEALEDVDGKFIVSKMSAEDVAKDNIDDFLTNNTTEGIEIVADPNADGAYSVTTSTGSVSECGLFDTIASQEGLTSIVVSNGVDEVSYTDGDDLEAFKASIDALVPQNNAAEEVTLTVTANF